MLKVKKERTKVREEEWNGKRSRREMYRRLEKIKRDDVYENFFVFLWLNNPKLIKLRIFYLILSENIHLHRTL